jgi:aspartyl protease family protein
MIALSVQGVPLSRTWGAETSPVEADAGGISVYAAANESAVAIGVLPSGEKATPIAETQGAGGIKWYLIKTKSGIVGWIKHDNEQARTLESFFRSRPDEPARIPIETQPRSGAAPMSGAMTIPVAVTGRGVVVPVTFNRSVNANLLLDTGASMTMISRRVATALALPATSAGLFSGIGGTITAPIARVESVKVGDAEVNGMAVSIHDLSRLPQIEGLLGMDFLGRFQVSVDSSRRILVLTPK